MKFRDDRMAQVVIDPEMPIYYQREAHTRGIAAMSRMEYPVWVIWRARILRALHPKVHHFVVWKTYDASSKRLIDVGMVCAHCGLGELA